MSTVIAAFDKHYEEMFCNMQIQSLCVKKVAVQILQSRKIYEVIASSVNKKIPWFFLGILHYRESNNNFTRHLHNGDTLKFRTRCVPKGRPVATPEHGFPFGYTFSESAVDAMIMPGQNFNLETDWSLNRMLYRFEKWNGFGYARLAKLHPGSGITNPYLWSGTNLYAGGKYDSDGHYNKNLVDEQMGAAPLLRYLTDKTLGLV